MWLIDTHTLALKRFQDDRTAVGKYAILSHRWQKEEVLHGDLAVGRNVDIPPATKAKFGFAKFENACTRAREDGYRYLWSDTCCINKESSAELSEAIASMWRWYSDAAVCYAYLCDIQRDQPAVLEREQTHDGLLRLLRPSVWFKRGWTLQELIAPSTVIFFDQNWNKIGAKSEMTETLKTITRIGENALRNRDMVRTYCVAKRMAWAARRETTRVEDEAYSLLGKLDMPVRVLTTNRTLLTAFVLGLFSVNMPMMYGEGRRAFLRLQEEIVRSSTDHSIFAWNPRPKIDAHHLSCLFAPSTKCFVGLRLHKSTIEDLADDESYELTNRGLRISLPVHYQPGYLFAVLNSVSLRLHDRGEVVVLKLKTHERQNQFVPKQNARTVCEIERSYMNEGWHTRSLLEPLRWMDLTILRHGLTSQVLIQIVPPAGCSALLGWTRIEDGRAPDHKDFLYETILTNPTGRQLSQCNLQLENKNRPGSFVYLTVGQCLRQAQSFATFRMKWSTEPVSEHQLLLRHPSTTESTGLLSDSSEGQVTAKATLQDAMPGTEGPWWLISISGEESP